MAKRPRKKNAMSTVNGTWKMWALGVSGAIITVMLSVILALCGFIVVSGLGRISKLEEELKAARTEAILLREGLNRVEASQRDQRERFDTFQTTLGRLNTQTADLALSLATAMMNQQAANVPAEVPKIIQKPSP